MPTLITIAAVYITSKAVLFSLVMPSDIVLSIFVALAKFDSIA